MRVKKTIFLLQIAQLFFVGNIAAQDVASQTALTLDLEIKEPPGEVFNRLTDIACGANGNICALDRKELVVYVFSAEVRFLKKMGKSGEGPGEFRRPCSIYIDSKGLIYVLDDINRRIEIFNEKADYVRSIKIANFPGGQSRNIVVDKNGEFYISGFYRASNITYILAKFSSAGELLKYISLPKKEYAGIELNEQDKDRVADYLSGGSMCIDQEDRIYFSYPWTYCIERIIKDKNEGEYPGKGKYRWTPGIFKTDQLNGMLFAESTRTRKIFSLDNGFIVNSVSVVDWEGDPKKEIQISSFQINPEKYFKILGKYSILDFYSKDLELIASARVDGKIYFLSVDKQGRLLGVKYDADDVQTIVRYNLEIPKH